MSRAMHRGSHGDHEKEYPQTSISLDHNYAMADLIGADNGLTAAQIDGLQPRLAALDQQLKEWRRQHTGSFFDLPYDTAMLKEIQGLVRHCKEWCRDVLVLAQDGSALGIKALQQALCHPSHNYFPIGRRHYHSRLFVADNPDPDSLYGLLDDLELKRLLVNVISKSGENPATLAPFLFVYHLLKGRLGPSQVRESFVLTTDPAQGDLRRLAASQDFATLNFPPQVAGRFSVLSAAGLFPAAMAGIDISGVLAGARFMDQRLQAAAPADNLAYRLAACLYLAYSEKNKHIHIFMPYATSLRGLADWVCQLWAACAGPQPQPAGAPAPTGPTPLRALGATDEPSQSKLFLEGPPDKIITFLEVAKFNHHLTVAPCFPEIDGLSYLAGQSLAQVLAAEKQATAFNLMQAGRPSLTINLPEINAFTIGQLIYLFEVAAVALAGLLDLNPFEQSGSEASRQTAFGLLGRPEYEARRQELENAPAPLAKYCL